MQPPNARRPIERSTQRGQIGLALLIAVAVIWGVYLLRWDSSNNLYGIFMLVLIPLSAILLMVAGILVLSSFRTPLA